MSQTQVSRRFPRVPVSFEAWGKTGLGSDNLEFKAHTMDLSAKGACLSMSHVKDVEPGRYIYIGVEFSQGEPPIEAHGKVSWIEPDPAGSPRRHLVGIEVTGMSTVREHKRWLDMISRHDANQEH